MASCLSLCSLFLFLALAQAAIVTYNFNLTWVTRNPDAAFDRPVIGINNQWPIPTIEATVGDTIVVNVENHLGNRTGSLHFHGMYQHGTNHMDGAGHVTQCPIPVGGKFKYEFDVSVINLKIARRLINFNRSNNREHTGTIPMTLEASEYSSEVCFWIKY